MSKNDYPQPRCESFSDGLKVSLNSQNEINFKFAYNYQFVLEPLNIQSERRSLK
jgi:hypothetical protein